MYVAIRFVTIHETESLHNANRYKRSIYNQYNVVLSAANDMHDIEAYKYQIDTKTSNFNNGRGFRQKIQKFSTSANFINPDIL